jgi:Concanavalin A-like lectin/glucanases superfamily
MKKQILLVAVTLTAVLVSCKKDIMESQSNPGSTQETTKSSQQVGELVIDQLKLGLNGWFPFDGNLNDSTGKLESQLMYGGRGVIYGNDRKNHAKSALFVNGNYFLKIKSVPQQTHTSLSVWFKPYSYADNTKGGIVHNDARGPMVWQSSQNMGGGVKTDVSQPGDYFDMLTSGWHHAVVTFDGSFVRVYIDYTLRGIIPHTAAISPTLVNYFVGWMNIYGNWKGYVDDLRFYGRTLTVSDINALYML